ncbi:hypothetical protein SAMN05216296_2650 [Pseudomonas pohangensis]|uniref:Uncharacterized protein n=1 Tax=Pseudomonas pohangensis TaxID=364197 RepID=A0A1H2GZF4_9PSED|nr:hypothetical protein SAMN05216296_2650 [Pseudomonas pohangensis]
MADTKEAVFQQYINIRAFSAAALLNGVAA